jgi:hypothetical protein
MARLDRAISGSRHANACLKARCRAEAHASGRWPDVMLRVLHTTSGHDEVR